MQITLGGRTVRDAVHGAVNLAELSLPAPPNFARANSILNPLGAHPARGWFLLLRQDLDALDLNALQTLTMTDDYGNRVTVPGLVIAREPTCLTPSGDAGDPNACYLVEVADGRWSCHNPYYSVPIDAQYNVRAPGWGNVSPTMYYAGSLQADGSVWQWNDMIGNIWGTMPALGSYPGLPIVPDGVPERYRFLGVSAWRSLCVVLDKLGCAVGWNPQSGTYTIVAIGTADTTTQKILTQSDKRLILDRQMPAVLRGRVPGAVRVHFHREQKYYGTEPATENDTTQFVTNAVYTVDVDAPANLAAGGADVKHPLWDDLAAVYDTLGTLVNADDLAARAQSRAAAFYAGIIGNGGGRMHQIYSGIVPISPTGTIRGVVWRQDQHGIGDREHPGGLITEVVRTPWTALRVVEDGQFEEALNDSSATRPPDFRVKEPVYPDLCQVGRLVTGQLQGNGFYDALLLRFDSDNNQWIEYEQIWIKDANL